jgi:PDZ domain-containing secreted protein
LIYCLEEGSPFKECNLDFDTENIINKFDGKEVANGEDLKAVIDEHKPGDKVKVTIDVYDNKNDALLPRDYIITIGSKNDETYEIDVDYETVSKTAQYIKLRNNKK